MVSTPLARCSRSAHLEVRGGSGLSHASRQRWTFGFRHRQRGFGALIAKWMGSRVMRGGKLNNSSEIPLLPITYRTPKRFWIWSPVLLTFIIWLILRNPSDWKIGIIISVLFCLFWLISGYVTHLDVKEEGFCYTQLFWFYEISWAQVKRVKLSIRNRGGNCLAIYQRENVPPRMISVDWLSMDKNNAREFIAILKFKAPDAIVDQEVENYLN